MSLDAKVRLKVAKKKFNLGLIKLTAKQYAKEVDAEIFGVINGKNSVLSEAVAYHLNSGGKRFRPFLCLAAADALGIGRTKVLPYAAACEMLHNSYLIHDDIEDGDTIRRDKPAVWVKYGLAHGVNTGDYMLSKALELVLKTRERGVDLPTVTKLIEHLVHTNNHTAEGQSMDICLRQNNAPSEGEYLRTIMKKTAYYLMSPIIGAAVIAGLDEKEIETLLKYGEKIGLAFQIQDDLLDLTKGKGRGGKIGNDIKEGKRTLMVCHVTKKATLSEKKKLFAILNKSREKTTQRDIRFVIGLYKKYDSLSYAKEKQLELVQRAKILIRNEKIKLRPLLERVADYVAGRIT